MSAYYYNTVARELFIWTKLIASYTLSCDFELRLHHFMAMN